VRLAGRAGLQVLGTLGGLVTGPLLLVAWLLAVLRRPGPLHRVRRWEAWRLRRTYRLRLEEPGGEFLRGGRTPLWALLCLATGWLMVELLVLAVAVVLGSLAQTLFGSAVTLSFDFWVLHRPAPLVMLVLGPGSLVMTALYAEGVAWVLTALLGRWTPVAREDALEPRLHQLLTTRRGVVLAIDDERRRIERDLHDGVQQNVVSLSVTLARARRAEDPQRSAQLLGQAHSQSQALIEEVRQVAWRVYPTALDEHGLASALEGVAGTSPVPVDLVTEVEETLPPAVESAAYFVVREAVTNVVKHAGATGARVEVRTDAARGRRLLRLAVRDDGVGGADPEGGGLQGLARRVAALDGSLDVDSPPGGPTVITAEIPCD
jgi:signal transduction histidine kinase